MFNWFKSSQPAVESFDLQGIAKLFQEGRVRRVITMVGAGISTAAGIPDFRSPNSGIYDNLEEYDLPYPMAVFTLSQFHKNPKPFFDVVKRLYLPEARPTIAHYFVRLLHEKGLLLRHYTQNVDNLDRMSGLPEDKLIEAHGTFTTGRCLRCKQVYSFKYMMPEILSGSVPQCEGKCGSVVKPDVVLFGENLPRRFYRSRIPDFSNCDLLIIMGTSLTVLPFSALIHRVGNNVVRLYLNRDYTDDTESGIVSFLMRFAVAGLRRNNLRCGRPDNTRDVFVRGDADESVLRLAELLGWKDELLAMKEETDRLIDERLAKEM